MPQVLNFSEKLDHLFSHVFKLGNMFPERHGFVAIIIIKTTSTGPSGKNKIDYKLLTQLHKRLHHGKLKNKLIALKPT